MKYFKVRQLLINYLSVDIFFTEDFKKKEREQEKDLHYKEKLL